MKRLDTYKLLNLASIVVIVLVAFIIGMFLYIRFWPVDVIKNSTWKLSVAKPSYHVGEDIPVHVVSDKIRNVGGTFTVTAECKNERNVFVSYPISESHVNRAKGHVETEISTRIPDRIPNLPATCRIAYVLEYSIYSFRSFSEYNFTNEFQLLPPEKETKVIVTPAPTFINTFSSVRTVPVVTQSAPVAPAQPQATPQTTPTAETPTAKPQTCTVNLMGIHLGCS